MAYRDDVHETVARMKKPLKRLAKSARSLDPWKMFPHALKVSAIFLGCLFLILFFTGKKVLRRY